MMRPHVFLIFDLLQDVNILWPLARLVADETPYQLALLVSGKFAERDIDGRWIKELKQLASSTSAEMFAVDSELDAFQALNGKHGIIFAGSESSLSAHKTSHNIFRTAPDSFVKATLQHGYECVGFLHNREQTIVHGDAVRFAADVVCSWVEPERLRHLHPGERDKVYVTGPSLLLRSPSPDDGRPKQQKAGLVCENLHSVRMNAAGDFKHDYMDTVFAFAKAMGKQRRALALRPHPGGQYVIRNAVKMPSNIALQNEPMYRVELGQYAFGISAPSSVLIDMVLAGIPTAVWQDHAGIIDTSHYDGLSRISSLEEWVSFGQEAVVNRDAILEKQKLFLEQTGILIDRDEVRRRYLSLIRSACERVDAAEVSRPPRVLYVANAMLETLQISFLRPLKELTDAGLVHDRLITEQDIQHHVNSTGAEDRGLAWVESQIEAFRPDIAIFCRYSGLHAREIYDRLDLHAVPTIFHVDDDLLNVPLEVGEAKFRSHNRPERKEAIRFFLNNCDYVYCSHERLEKRYREQGFNRNIGHGRIFSSGKPLVAAEQRPVRKIGYMGFDKTRDLNLILPQLIQFLDERPEIRFELMGSFTMPDELAAFGDRVQLLEPVRPYSAFLEYFATLGWDIGLCPLGDTPFNRVKTNTKWVEYTMAGAAVIATADMAYDECCADDCGVLVEQPEGWLEALRNLSSSDDVRYRIAVNAQRKLVDVYSTEKLRTQVLSTFDLARHLHDGAGDKAA